MPEVDNTVDAAPVTVHCAVGGLWFPNSKGNLNCFSALQKWLEVEVITFMPAPLSKKEEPKINPSTKVEQAPKIPKKGISKSRIPKLVEIHWFNKSPENKQSIWWAERLDFFKTVSTAVLGLPWLQLPFLLF